MKMKTAPRGTRNGTNGHGRNGRNGHTTKLDAMRISRRIDHEARVKTVERVNADLSGLLSGVSEELVRLLEVSEDVSKKVVAAELDLCREQEVHARLQSDHERLAKDVEEARAANAELARRKDELDDETARLRKQIDCETRDVAKLDGDCAAMAKELKELQAENAALEARRAKLAEDIARLKKLRQEYLANIGKLKGDKDDLTQ